MPDKAFYVTLVVVPRVVFPSGMVLGIGRGSIVAHTLSGRGALVLTLGGALAFLLVGAVAPTASARGVAGCSVVPVAASPPSARLLHGRYAVERSPQERSRPSTCRVIGEPTTVRRVEDATVLSDTPDGDGGGQRGAPAPYREIPGGEVSPVLPLGTGMTLIGLGIASLGWRLRR